MKAEGVGNTLVVSATVVFAGQGNGYLFLKDEGGHRQPYVGTVYSVAATIVQTTGKGKTKDNRTPSGTL